MYTCFIELFSYIRCIFQWHFFLSVIFAGDFFLSDFFTGDIFTEWIFPKWLFYRGLFYWMPFFLKSHISAGETLTLVTYCVLTDKSLHIKIMNCYGCEFDLKYLKILLFEYVYLFEYCTRLTGHRLRVFGTPRNTRNTRWNLSRSLENVKKKYF